MKFERICKTHEVYMIPIELDSNDLQEVMNVYSLEMNNFSMRIPLNWWSVEKNFFMTNFKIKDDVQLADGYACFYITPLMSVDKLKQIREKFGSKDLFLSEIIK